MDRWRKIAENYLQKIKNQNSKNNITGNISSHFFKQFWISSSAQRDKENMAPQIKGKQIDFIIVCLKICQILRILLQTILSKWLIWIWLIWLWCSRFIVSSHHHFVFRWKEFLEFLHRKEFFLCQKRSYAKSAVRKIPNFRWICPRRESFAVAGLNGWVEKSRTMRR